MPACFSEIGTPFVGREEYISRYRARLNHYPLSIYVGLQGIGKTTLMRRLSQETESIGLEKTVYLPVSPGEGVASLLARAEARLSGRIGQSVDSVADAFRRLTDVLSTHKCLLVLDDLHNIKTEDMSGLVRTIQACKGEYRVLAAMQHEIELAARDKAGMHLELVKPLNAAEVDSLLQAMKLPRGAIERLKEDAVRGGSAAHPLTLIFLASLLGDDLPDDEFLRTLTSRSIKSFQSIWERAAHRLSEAELDCLARLTHVGLPLSQEIAEAAFGEVIQALLSKRLVENIDGSVVVHAIIRRLVQDRVADLDAHASKVLAAHLQENAMKKSEPMGVIRAGEILARAGHIDKAVETLSAGWEAVRNFGFLKAYLRTLASIPADETMSGRLRVLSARARMRQGLPNQMRDEMTELSESKDPWTASRSLAALTYIHSEQRNHTQVVESYKRLAKVTRDADILLNAGMLAASSMVRLEQVNEAEELAHGLLKLLEGKKQFDREGEMHRLIARVCAQAGRLDDAIAEAGHAARCFEKTGDLYHAAAAHGYIGDLYRETGDFEMAKTAFEQFRTAAVKWGDRNLIQIAELADAWVSLDIGDLTHASKLIAEVEKEMTGVASRRLKRYLAAAKVMLEAGRGNHEAAVGILPRVIDLWVGAGQQAIADILRAQLVRSRVATGEVDGAQEIVDEALSRLDPNVAGPRVAMFRREAGLIRLRRKDSKGAQRDLSTARKLFAAGGNRREEVLTLHRLAHAALDLGNVPVAQKRAKEVLTLAREIKHERAIALARELDSRLALVVGEPLEAVEAGREAMMSLRKLGDDLGTLHVSELLLRAYISAGDLSSAIRLGPRVGAHAERVGIREVRIRAIVLTGAALLRKDNVEAARRCFREIPVGVLGPTTGALMWRLGEALALYDGDIGQGEKCRGNWVSELQRLPQQQQELGLSSLSQLALAPRVRCCLTTKDGEEMIGNENLAWLDRQDFRVVIDLHALQIRSDEDTYSLEDANHIRILNQLIQNEGRVVAIESLEEAVEIEEGEKPLSQKQRERKVKNMLKSLEKLVKDQEQLKLTQTATGVKLKLPKNSASITPLMLWDENLSPAHLSILSHLSGVCSASLQGLQDATALSRAAARRELNDLIEAGHVEGYREGRGQSFRIA